MRIFRLFTEHPSEVGETYFSHAAAASKIALKFAIAAPMQLLHAVFPFIKPPFGSDTASMRSFLRKMSPNVALNHVAAANGVKITLHKVFSGLFIPLNHTTSRLQCFECLLFCFLCVLPPLSSILGHFGSDLASLGPFFEQFVAI